MPTVGVNDVTDSIEAGEALTVLARFIEQRASESIAETIGVDDVVVMATQVCTTQDVLCRALEIGNIVSALVDRLDWPLETKAACREVLAGFAERDMEWMARMRRYRRMLN